MEHGVRSKLYNKWHRRWETGSRYPTIKHIGLIKEILKIEE